MRKSIVYFIALLTVCSLSFTLIPSGFSQTENVKILNYTWYIDLQGYLVVVGEIQNICQNTLASVVLHGTVYTSDGKPTESSVPAWVSYLSPQQKAPFYMVFYSASTADGTWPAGDVAGINMEVVQADATSTYQYSDLKITSQSQTIGNTPDDKGVFWVRGTIQNTGSQTAKNVSVVATFYNSTGAVIAAGHTYTETVIPNILSPSGTASFEVAAYDLDQTIVPTRLKIDHYSLLIQVIGPLLQGTAPVITPTSTPGPVTTGSPSDTTSPTNSPTGTPPSNSNPTNSTTAEWLYPAVIVIAIAAIIGVALVLSKRKPHQTSKAIKQKK